MVHFVGALIVRLASVIAIPVSPQPVGFVEPTGSCRGLTLPCETRGVDHEMGRQGHTRVRGAARLVWGSARQHPDNPNVMQTGSRRRRPNLVFALLLGYLALVIVIGGVRL
jgi:hypothetical protein